MGDSNPSSVLWKDSFRKRVDQMTTGRATYHQRFEHLEYLAPFLEKDTFTYKNANDKIVASFSLLKW